MAGSLISFVETTIFPRIKQTEKCLENFTPEGRHYVELLTWNRFRNVQRKDMPD